VSPGFDTIPYAFYLRMGREPQPRGLALRVERDSVTIGLSRTLWEAEHMTHGRHVPRRRPPRPKHKRCTCGQWRVTLGVRAGRSHIVTQLLRRSAPQTELAFTKKGNVVIYPSRRAKIDIYPYPEPRRPEGQVQASLVILGN
jgi:hypothetical protein